MASYAVTATQRGAHAKTLVASTVDTVTFAWDWDNVEVLSHDGAAAIYFTTDGSAPTVAGAGTDVVPAAIGSVLVPVPTQGDTVVKLISAGTPTYSVVGARK